MVDEKLAARQVHPTKPPVDANASPPPASFLKKIKGFVMKRPFTLLALGTTAAAYTFHKLNPNYTQKQLAKVLGQSSPGSGVQENLIIKREQDDLDSYKYSVTKAMHGEESASTFARSASNSLNQALAKLNLSSEQLQRLNELGTQYDELNREIGGKITKDIRGKELMTALQHEPENTKSTETLSAENRIHQDISRLVLQKVHLDINYLKNISGILSEEQFKIWKEQLTNNRGSMLAWTEMLSRRPVAFAMPEQPKVFVLTFDGDVMASQVKKFRKEVTAVLSTADCERGDSVVILLNSGGGTVNGYGLAAAQLERLKARGLRLTVCVDEVAASGGYLMACVADHIVASPFAMMGSIGVISTMPNFYERLKREGVEVEDVTAGQYKRTLTPYKKITPADKSKMKQDVEDIHGIFKDFVSQYRPQVNIAEVATGEVWLGSVAIKKGLCDELKTSDDFLLDQIKQGAEVYRVRYGLRARGLKGMLQELEEERDSNEASAGGGGLAGLIGAMQSMASALVLLGRLYASGGGMDGAFYADSKKQFKVKFEPQLFDGDVSSRTRFE